MISSALVLPRSVPRTPRAVAVFHVPLLTPRLHSLLDHVVKVGRHAPHVFGDMPM